MRNARLRVPVIDLAAVERPVGVPGQSHAQLMGHAKVDTLNVNTQAIEGSLRGAADVVDSELITIDHRPAGVAEELDGRWLAALDDFRPWLVDEAA